MQKVKARAKAIITLFLVGDIDVIANILQIITYLLIYSLNESNKKLYVLGFLLQLTENGLLFSEMLVYLVYEEDKKHVAKLDGFLLKMYHLLSQQSWRFTSTTMSSSK